MDLGRRIAAWRTLKGWSQQQLADKLGVTFAAVYQWETGRTRPSTKNIERLAALFRVSLERFFGRVPARAA